MKRVVFSFFSMISFIYPNFFLNAQEPFEAISLFEGDSSGIVFDCIDTISGAYKESEDDLATASLSPIVVHRSYSSYSGLWRFFPHCALYVGLDKIYASEPYGTPLVYSEGQNSNWVIQDKDNSGLVNSSEIEMRATNNLKNNFLEITERGITLTTCDGTLRYYEKSPNHGVGLLCLSFPQSVVEGKVCFRLVKEVLPWGNSFLYHYDVEGRLVRIEAVNKSLTRLLAYVDVEYKNDEISLRANDTQWVIYNFQNGRLAKVSASSHRGVQYEYTEVAGIWRLNKKALSEKRVATLSYTTEGKVYQLQIPFPHKPFYTFSYGPSSTLVMDVDGNKTVYNHKNGKLRTKETWNASQLYCIEKLHWKNMDSADETGMLLGKDLFDSNNVQVAKKAFSYDSAGNLVSEREKDKFSDDRFHNILEEQKQFGSRTRYFYLEGTNLITKKLTLTREGKIVERRFFSYNDDGALIKEIIDDGDREEVQDLSGVKERSIREIQPRSSVDENEEIIDQKYWTASSQQEKLVRRTHRHMNVLGQVVKSEVYGSDSSLAKSERFRYYFHGNCWRKTNTLGHVIEQVFDLNDNLKEIRELQTGKVTKFSYDLNDRLIAREVSSKGLISRVTYGYDAKGNKIIEVDRLGRRTTFEYDFLSRLISIHSPKVIDEKGAVVQPEEKRTYDILGNIITKTDPKGYTDTYAYVDGSKLESITYSDGTKEHFYYSSDGSLKFQMAKNQCLTNYKYDWQGRVIFELTFLQKERDAGSYQTTSKFSPFHLEKVCNTAKGYTLFSYDDLGRLKSEIQPSQAESEINDPHSRIVDYEYDAQGRMVKKKRWTAENDFFFECMRYDELDRTVETWIEQADGTKYQRVVIAYDAEGNVIRQEKDGIIEETTYDGFGRPTQISTNKGFVTTIEYDETPLDKFGARYLIKRTTTKPGYVTTEVFDAHNRCKEITKTKVSAALLSKCELFYDANGNLAAQKDYIIPISQNRQEFVRTEWLYGPENRLEMVQEAANCPERRATTYTYTAFGQVASIRKSHDQNEAVPFSKIDFQYTALGLVEKKAYNFDSETFSYDRFGRVIRTSNNKATIERHYTVFNEIESETSFGQCTVSFKYDRIGRVIKIVFPDASALEYHYNCMLLNAISRKDKFGKIIYQHLIQGYDENGHIVDEKLIGNLGSRKTSYEGGLPNKISYNPFGENSAERDSGGKIIKFITQEESKDFSYDELGRLQTESGQSGCRYTYDSLNNLVFSEKNSSAKPSHYAYNALNELISREKDPIRHDALGSLTDVLRDGEKLKVQYNDFNKPMEYSTLQDHEKKWQCSEFDGFGRRIRFEDGLQQFEERNAPFQEHKQSNEKILYFGSVALGAVDSENKIRELRIPLCLDTTFAASPIAVETEKKVFLPLVDIQNNIYALVDSDTAKMVESYKYSAFGERYVYDEKGIFRGNSSYLSPWGWKGLRQDPLTNLIWMGARDYDPQTHRFLTCDPAGFLDGMNRYAYADNDPINFEDPTGLCKIVWPGYCCWPCNYPPFCGPEQGRLVCEDDEEKILANGGNQQHFTHTLQDLSNAPFFSESVATNKTVDLPGYERFYSEKSRPYKIPGKKLRKGGILYTNGIGTNFMSAQAIAKYLSGLGGGVEIQGMHNASGGRISDVGECILNRLGIMTEPGIEMREAMNQLANNPDPSVKYLVICNSQGAITVRDVLLGLDPAQRKKFIVVGIAPGAFISRDDCFRATHYLSARDFVPLLDPIGLGMAVLQGTARWRWPHKDAPWLDHTILSPTYKRDLKNEIDDYLQKYGGL